MSQRTSEWIEMNDQAYHERQFKEPYRSTVKFCDYLETLGLLRPDSSVRILDLGCGQGANLYYLARRYPNCTFTGVDINLDIVDCGNKILKEMSLDNCTLEVGDIYSLDSKYYNNFDGIISLQTISWLPEFSKPLAAICSLGAPWVAVSSLFFDGPLSCTIEIHEYDESLNPSRDSFYNVYSIPVVSAFMKRHGYSKFQHQAFEIDIDLPRPEKVGKGTYTEKLETGRRLQISGPLLMPWRFVVASR